MLPSEFLHNRILDLDSLNGFAKVGKGVAPKHYMSNNPMTMLVLQ